MTRPDGRASRTRPTFALALLALAGSLPLGADTSRPPLPFNPVSAALSATLDAQTAGVRGLTFGAGGRALAILGMDKRVKLLHPAEDGSGTVTKDIPGQWQADRMWLSPDGRTLIGLDSQELMAVDSRNGVRRSIRRSRITSLAVSPDGRHVVDAGADRRSSILVDVATGDELRALADTDSPPTAAAFSPDGRRVAATLRTQAARIWDTATGAVIVTLEGTFHGTVIAWSHDGKTVAIAPTDNSIRIFDAATGQEKLTLGERPHRVHGLAWSLDGHWLASGHSDGFVRVWDTRTGREARRFEPQGGAVLAVAFSPDGRTLVTATHNGKVQMWGRSMPMLARQRTPGYLGVHTPEEDDGARGVAISAITAGSAAERAGLKAGDVILTAAGREINTYDDLRAAIAATGGGQEMELKYSRDGRELRVRVRLGVSRPP